MTASDVSLYYDELHRWTAKDKSFQTFSGLENDTIHRFLIDPATAAFSPDTIYHFIDPHMPPHGTARGLDAGCGYGGTCFRSLKVHGGRWTGITISPEQCTAAGGIAAARKLGEAIDFRLMSYDDALPGRYNIIIAIESLIHSADPAATLSNLAASLDSGGRLIIVDDMPAAQIGSGDAALLSEFKRAWRCPVAPTAQQWIAYAGAGGLRLITERDFNVLMKPRSEAELDAALAELTAQRAGKSQAGFARLSDAEIGGLHLERLHRRGAVRYVMLVFGK